MSLLGLSRLLVSRRMSLPLLRFTFIIRNMSVTMPNMPEVTCPAPECGLILGVYSLNDGRQMSANLTPTGQRFNKRACERLVDLMKKAGPVPKLGEYRLFYDLDPYFPITCLVGLGMECAGYDEAEQMDFGKENIRIAAAVGVKTLLPFKLNKLYVEAFGHAESTAEGAALAMWTYQELKHPSKRVQVSALELFDDCDWTGWQIGLQKAAAQNLSRQLMETPGNLMTPIIFAQNAVEVLCKSGINVEVKVKHWCESLGMGAFLSVGKGSCENALFMEISYYGSGNFKERPIVLIGKGCTFDSGGACLHDKHEMIHSRGDIAGAACIVAACRAVASLQLPLNIRGLIPLCEHMPGCNAMHPGDVAVAMNGKSILIQDTRSEGRLMLADALCYAQSFWPRFIIDVGSMTRGMQMALSTAAVGVFSNSDRLWKQIRISGIHTGDRVWRMPLFRHYIRKITDSSSFDYKNYGKRPLTGDPCRCAAFLKEFVPCGEWIHIDNFGVMYSDGQTDPPYLCKGMTGRPTRTIVEFLSQLCCRHDEC